MYNLLCIIVVYNKGTKGNELQQGHEKFSVSAASLISDRSRELARKTSGFRHTHAVGLDAAATTKILQRSFCWSSFPFCSIYTLATSSRINAENVASFLDERLSERPRFASFVQVGAPSFSGAGTSTIKPKQNKGSERLANEKRCYVFVFILKTY